MPKRIEIGGRRLTHTLVRLKHHRPIACIVSSRFDVRRNPCEVLSVYIGSLSACLVVAAAAAAFLQGRVPSGEWRYFGGDKAFTRYSPLDQINRDNVKNLQIVWRRPAVSDQLTQAFPDLRVNNYLRSTPIFIDGMLYTQNAHGLVGRHRRRDRQDGVGAGAVRAHARGGERRGARAASTTGAAAPATPTSGSSRFAASISTRSNAETGKPVAGFGDQGRASLHFDENQPLAGRFNDSTGPLVVGNVVVVTGNTAGAGDSGTSRRKRRPRTSAASTRRAASCSGRSTSCRGRASSATTPGATSRGRSPAISARGIR